MIAFVRALEPEGDRGEKSQGLRSPLRAKTIRKQHAHLVMCLKEIGAMVEPVPALAGFESSVLVGDIAVLLPETAVIARPSDAARLHELESLIRTLGQHRPVQSIVDPGILDGADVLKIGRTIYVAESPRTNADGIGQLRDIVATHDYSLRIISLLSDAALTRSCSFIPPHFLLVNSRRVDATQFQNVIPLEVDDAEPNAATTLTVGRTTLVPASSPRTRKRLSDAGVATMPMDISEFERVGAGLTSLVLLLEPRTTSHSAQERGMMSVRAADVPLPDGHASQAVVHGGFVFTSAVFPFNAATAVAKRITLEEQIERMIRNLAAVLTASGSSLERVVRTTVHIAEPKYVPRIDAVWARMFGDHRPARTIVANGALPPGVLVGIEAVAAQADKPR